ncbi:hypothetical protein QFC19_006502 [Naganishia cerealis]|uniref:Uncharacterized protein n=1 Tax=Naganishia cerealis TaxID=610337 RepID=A0ACC2VGK1_9TREE|nr:hypothetical protein QFC19_006502 [Naganishia cerealis]
MSSLDRYEKDIDEKGLDGLTTTRVVSIDQIPFEEKSDGKHHLHAGTGQVDAAAALAAKAVGHQLDPIQAKKLLRKIDKNLLPLMMVLYMMQFVDKTTLGSSSILGIKTDTHLTTTEYNLLGSLFYIAYLAFEWPQNIALQRFPVGKWMVSSLHLRKKVARCTDPYRISKELKHYPMGNFPVLLRRLQELCRSSDSAIRASAQVISGLLSFGVLQIGLDAPFKPWRIFFLLTGAMTFVVALAYWIWFPDNPMNAKFLTEEEKVMAIERIRDNKTGVENKTWKREQFVEALCDWKLWTFAVFAAFNNIPNSLTNQNSLIIKSLGFETWQTTLLGCVSGVVEIVTIWASTLALKRWPNHRGYIGAVWLVPNVLGAILIVTLPYSNKAGILVCLYITGVGTPGFVIALAWINSCVTGHTKKTTTNAAFLVGYCLGNLLAPLMWLDKYKPRNRIPWTIIIISYSICVVMMLGIRWRLEFENKQRDKLQAESGTDDDDYGYVDEILEDGTKVTHKIDKAFMDLTDKQNLSFRLVVLVD